MVALGGRSIENFLSQQRWKQERVAFADWRGEKRNHEIGTGARSHEPGHKFSRGGIAAILLRIGNDRIRQAVLVINGNDWQILPVSHVTSERLEVGDDQVNLPLVDEIF